MLGIGQKPLPVRCLHLIHDSPQLAFLPLRQRKVQHDPCDVKNFVIKFLVFIRVKHSLQRKAGAASMTAPTSYDLVLPVARSALLDPLIEVQGLRQQKRHPMNCGPVLQSVQPDRCLEQPPDQLRDHRAIVGVQDLVIRQGGLAARFLHQLLLPVDQGVAVVRQLLGQPPGFGVMQRN